MRSVNTTSSPVSVSALYTIARSSERQKAVSPSERERTACFRVPSRRPAVTHACSMSAGPPTEAILLLTPASRLPAASRSRPFRSHHTPARTPTDAHTLRPTHAQTHRRMRMRMRGLEMRVTTRARHHVIHALRLSNTKPVHFRAGRGNTEARPHARRSGPCGGGSAGRLSGT